MRGSIGERYPAFIMITAALLALALFQSPKPADAFIEVDFAKVERTIKKEPKYVAEPRYGLFVLDPAGHFTCWAVFDKSTPDAAHYDVLYFDRNGNGDLTEDGERFYSDWSDTRAAAGLGIELKVGDVRVPGTDLVHKGLRFGTVMKADKPGFWFEMKWNGKEEISGGYSPAGPNLTIYSPNPKNAPIFRPAPLGAMSFALYTWGEDEVEFTPGRQEKISIMIGKRGSTSDSISVMSEHFLDLNQDELSATLVVPTTSGVDKSVLVLIHEHC